MTPLRILAALALSLPTAIRSEAMQADHFFVVQAVEASGQPELVVRISENARARVFQLAVRSGQRLRLTSRVVQRTSVWNPGWPFYTERHRLLPIDTLIARCPSRAPDELARRIANGARIHGSAWCPAVKVVREIKHPRDA